MKEHKTTTQRKMGKKKCTCTSTGYSTGRNQHLQTTTLTQTDTFLTFFSIVVRATRIAATATAIWPTTERFQDDGKEVRARCLWNGLGIEPPKSSRLSKGGTSPGRVSSEECPPFVDCRTARERHASVSRRQHPHLKPHVCGQHDNGTWDSLSHCSRLQARTQARVKRDARLSRRQNNERQDDVTNGHRTSQ